MVPSESLSESLFESLSESLSEYYRWCRVRRSRGARRCCTRSRDAQRTWCKPQHSVKLYSIIPEYCVLFSVPVCARALVNWCVRVRARACVRAFVRACTCFERAAICVRVRENACLCCSIQCGITGDQASAASEAIVCHACCVCARTCVRASDRASRGSSVWGALGHRAAGARHTRHTQHGLEGRSVCCVSHVTRVT
jgi:hypothetical protein